MPSLKHVVCRVDNDVARALIVGSGSGNKTLDKTVHGVSLVEQENCMFGWHVQVLSGANIEDLPCSSVESELLPPTLRFTVQALEGLVAVPLRRVGDWLPKGQLEEETRDILHRKDFVSRQERFCDTSHVRTCLKLLVMCEN